MSRKEQVHWSSDQGFFQKTVGDFIVHIAIGYILGELEKDDEYFLMLRVQKLHPIHKDKKIDAVRFDLRFESWNSMLYWINVIPPFITPFIFVKEEETLLNKDEKIRKQQNLIEAILVFVQQLPEIKERIENERLIPDSENPIDTSKLQ
ncbi:MAG: hypothetical protein HYT27_01170 [Parcubacteria group bacterium]|nr:hypothetical protein [Parcubacteria group bacterium]